MFKTTTIVVIVLLAALLGYAATRPDTFRLQRTTAIKASPEKIFPLINDLRRFNAWNPFDKKDPNMKGSYRGADSGKGAAYAFDGNNDVGKGSLEITESAPARKVAMRLDMIEPFEAHNAIAFTLEPAGDVTNVTWAMEGRMPYVAKVFGLFCDMDGKVGKDFEAGLASLKALAEKS